MGIAMNTRCGFTLLELLVSVTSSLLIVAAVGSFSRAESRMVDRESRRLRLREANRRVLEMIAREVRGAGFAPVPGSFDGGRDGLAVAARDRIELRSDLHGATTTDPPDGTLDVDSDERIGFFLNASRGTVSESVGRQTLPLTLDSTVSAGGLVFRYLDACGDEILPAAGTDLSADERPRVRSIAVGLTIKEGAESVAEELTAALRNRRSLRCG
jgi:Tfp pilus assembly protein PilW